MISMEKVQRITLFISSLLCIALSMVISVLLNFYLFRIPFKFITEEPFNIVLIVVISYIVMALIFIPKKDLTQRNAARIVIEVFFINVIAFIIIIFLLKMFSAEFLDNGQYISITFISNIILLSFSTLFFKFVMTENFRKTKLASLVGVVASRAKAAEFIENLKKDWTKKIVGVMLIDAIDDDTHDDQLTLGLSSERNKNITEIPIIENEQIEYIEGVPVKLSGIKFLDWVRTISIDELYLDVTTLKNEDIDKYLMQLEDMGTIVHINIPSAENSSNAGLHLYEKYSYINGHPLLTYTRKVQNINLMTLKRVFDIVFSLIGLIMSAVIIGIVAIPLLIESRGPLFFKQKRVGRNGRIFVIYKLRSMYMDAEERKKELLEKNEMNGHMFKLKNDPRITKVGAFIRKTSIDELPQFWNILKGDMSLIGTRPPTVDEYNQYMGHHKRRLSMKPGISGMWQVSGRNNITDFEEVVKLDVYYIDNWSPWLDVKIFFKTIKAVITRNGSK